MAKITPKEYQQAVKESQEAGYIKIRARVVGCNGVNSEGLWATPIAPNQARIGNIPSFAPEYSLGDIVEYDSFGYITKIVTKVANTRHVAYDAGDTIDKTKETYRKLVASFKEHKIECEGALAGIMAIAVPLDIKEKALGKICKTLKVHLYKDTQTEGRAAKRKQKKGK